MASAREEADRKARWCCENIEYVSFNTFKMIMDLREKDYNRIFQALASLMAVRALIVEGMRKMAVPVRQDAAERAADESMAKAAERMAQSAIENLSDAADRIEAKRRLYFLAASAPLANLKEAFERLG